MNTKALQRIGIVAANHAGYVEAMFTAMEAGIIAVPLRDEHDQQRLRTASVETIVTPKGGTNWMQRRFTPFRNDQHPALISFTSGTEGPPKGVALTHRNLADVVERLNSLMQIDETISEYIGVPIYHSFGFGRCRAVAAVGGKFFIPGSGFNPSEIATLLQSGEINAISSVPSLWRVLLANRDLIGRAGRRVRWIEIGSQYMSRQEKEALKHLFPNAMIVQHYGLTEASRTTLLEIHREEGEVLESVGRVYGNVEVKLTSEGRIAIRGNHVADHYLINGAESKLCDGNGWFLTQDLGDLEDGYLYYRGRADDVINCGGIKVHPEALETKLYAIFGYDSQLNDRLSQNLAICRKSDPLRGEGFLVAVTKELGIDHQILREKVVEATQSFGVNATNAIALVEVDRLPKTATGKIQRKQLASWYATQTIEEATIPDGTDDPTPSGTSRSSKASPTSIQTIFCGGLNLSQVRPQDTFISLGGDSLSYVQLSMELERHLGFLPQNWEQTSLEELEKLTVQHSHYTSVETSIVLRAVAILGVVLNHALAIPSAYIEGGAMLLLMIAGLNFARFQSCALFRGGFWKNVFSLLKNLLIPYWIILFLFRRHANLSAIFLVENLVRSVPDDISIYPFPFWFIDIFVQIVLFFSVLFIIQPLRSFAQRSPWVFGFVLFVLGVSINILSYYVGQTTYLFQRFPHILFWLFALGWCIHFAQTRTQKLVTTLTLGFVISLMAFNALLIEELWILLGGAVLLWLPSIPVFKLVKLPVQALSAAAYYIFLTHMIFIEFFQKNVGIYHPWFNVFTSLLGGLLVWQAVQRFNRSRVQQL